MMRSTVSAPAPMLVITSDEIIPASTARFLPSGSPARLRVAAGADHLFFLERPEQTALVIEAFLT